MHPPNFRAVSGPPQKFPAMLRPCIVDAMRCSIHIAEAVSEGFEDAQVWIDKDVSREELAEGFRLIDAVLLVFD
eukprot:CAMPEP_0180717464 /NCGR_PEP_ID=MMETSP1038_2-20121128/13986_1 /TAXON_ID=632150 /ORGANISM="Azadinium spinosum, Strain 3D9" /LENGTH=73 /DNA_ID=CAMNT_0022749931 /DNA_START=77 /DNA_END=298 /DNA_ORIENTATION=-